MSTPEVVTPIDYYLKSWDFGVQEAAFAFDMASSMKVSVDDRALSDGVLDAVRTARRFSEQPIDIDESVASAALVDLVVHRMFNKS